MLERHEGEGASPAIAGQTKPYMCRVLNNVAAGRSTMGNQHEWCEDVDGEKFLFQKVDAVIGMANTRTD